MTSKQNEESPRLGEYVIYPMGDLKQRKRYGSQIEAEIRIRKQMCQLSTFRKGGLVLKVVGVVTNDMVESV